MSDTKPCEHCGKLLALNAQYCDQCGCSTKTRKKSSTAKTIGLAGVGLVAALMVIGMVSGPSKPDGQAASATAADSGHPAPPPPPPPLYSADQIAAAYAENSVAADQALKGRRFRVQGVVADINTDFMGDPYLTLRGGQNEFMEPHFGFGKADADALAQLRRGNSVTLECTGRGDIAKTPMADDCQMI